MALWDLNREFHLGDRVKTARYEGYITKIEDDYGHLLTIKYDNGEGEAWPHQVTKMKKCVRQKKNWKKPLPKDRVITCLQEIRWKAIDLITQIDKETDYLKRTKTSLQKKK